MSCETYRGKGGPTECECISELTGGIRKGLTSFRFIFIFVMLSYSGKSRYGIAR